MLTSGRSRALLPVLTLSLLLAVAFAGCSSQNNAAVQSQPDTNATIAVGNLPVGVAFGEGSVWVANYRDNTVSRIDPRSRTVIANIPVGTHPKGVAVGEGSVWVIDYDEARITRIDPKTNSVAQSLPVGSSYIGIGAGAVWVTNEDEGTVLAHRPACRHRRGDDRGGEAAARRRGGGRRGLGNAV